MRLRMNKKEATQAMNPNRALVRFLWTAVIFLAFIGLAVATRRTIVLLKPTMASSAKNPAVQLDVHFANHATLTLAHILPAMLFMVLGPLQFVRGLRAKYSAGSPLVGAGFSDRQRGRGRHRAHHGVRKNDWRRGRKGGDHLVRDFLPDRAGESAVACASPRVRPAS